MRPFVVDASVSAAWLLPGEATAYTEAALQATASTEVWVPVLWQLEMTNLLISAQRRKRIEATQRLSLVRAASALRLRVDRESASMIDLDALATAHGLSAYDAVYLDLAIRRKLPLATLDAALIKAISATGVERAALVPAGRSA